jgi:hypothetical protein
MVDVFFIGLGGLFTAMVILGVSQMKMKHVLLGVFCYSFLPILGEILGWIIDKQLYHLLFISLFLCQLVLTSIWFQEIDYENTEVSKALVRVFIAIFVINLMSAVTILGLLGNINAVFGMYHILICGVLVPVIIKSIKGAVSAK